MSSDHAFLGTGWGFPPFFGAGGSDVEVVSGPVDIHQSLRILLSTRLGERVMREDYGCDLSGLLFEEMSQGLINQITGLVSDAILYHEPRIDLSKIDVASSEAEQGLLLIQLEYSIRGTNSRFNMVYPFYLFEATTTT